MKVVFLQDVSNVAKAGEIKEVAGGYARNFLIPKKIATPANPALTSTIQSQLKARAKEQEKIKGDLTEIASQLDGKEIILKAQVGTNERLYGSITSADIVAEMANTFGLDIDKRKVELAEPIRQLGSFEVAIRLGQDIIPKIKVTVTAKETEPSAN